MSSGDVDPPRPQTRAKALAALFGGFALLVSLVILVTEEQADYVDYLFIIGAPPVFAAFAYFVGLHVSDKAGD